ncbi:DUF2270 domain-containing protein [Halalkalicoccus salilacus]|uniref:DUF2270 domain-containing protein n=1 Tax=Halalkalicoccus TaxID=332246 RepID=UPI003607DBFD
MSYHAAISHRLRRVYLPLLLGLLSIWVFRLATVHGSRRRPFRAFPEPSSSEPSR